MYLTLNVEKLVLFVVDVKKLLNGKSLVSRVI